MTKDDGKLLIEDGVLRRHLSQLHRDVRPSSPAMRKLMSRIGDMIVEQTRRHVDEGIDVNDRPFVRLSPSTADRPRGGRPGAPKRGYDHILRDTGAMVISVRATVLRGEVRVGPTGQAERARGLAHQHGNARRRLPQREWLGLRDGDYAEIADEVDAWLREVIRGE